MFLQWILTRYTKQQYYCLWRVLLGCKSNLSKYHTLFVFPPQHIMFQFLSDLSQPTFPTPNTTTAASLTQHSQWIWAIPRIGKYRIRQEMLILEDGATSHTLVKVPLDELAEWDRTHDALGRERTHGAAVSTSLETDNGGVIKGTSSWNQTESLEEKSSV